MEAADRPAILTGGGNATHTAPRERLAERAKYGRPTVRCSYVRGKEAEGL